MAGVFGPRWLGRTRLGQAGPAPSADAFEEEIEAEYAELIRRHFVADIRWDGLSLDTDPRFAPGESVIARTTERGDTAVVEVRKRMSRWLDAEHVYEFGLARVDGRWVITGLFYCVDGTERLRML